MAADDRVAGPCSPKRNNRSLHHFLVTIKTERVVLKLTAGLIFLCRLPTSLDSTEKPVGPPRRLWIPYSNPCSLPQANAPIVFLGSSLTYSGFIQLSDASLLVLFHAVTKNIWDDSPLIRKPQLCSFTAKHFVNGEHNSRMSNPILMPIKGKNPHMLKVSFTYHYGGWRAGETTKSTLPTNHNKDIERHRTFLVYQCAWLGMLLFLQMVKTCLDDIAVLATHLPRACSVYTGGGGVSTRI